MSVYYPYPDIDDPDNFKWSAVQREQGKYFLNPTFNLYKNVAIENNQIVGAEHAEDVKILEDGTVTHPLAEFYAANLRWFIDSDDKHAVANYCKSKGLTNEMIENALKA
ncbi:hypothetical protein KXY27_004546 [Salmonella enterica]|nr:hypothetical protein [Salmonella enterica]EHU5767744.1 hypothetical protein [Salmonella enterica]